MTPAKFIATIREGRHDGFSPCDLACLAALDDGPVTNIQRLADRIGFQRTTASISLHYLEELGLVTLEEPGRPFPTIATQTEAGAEKLAAILNP